MGNTDVRGCLDLNLKGSVMQNDPKRGLREFPEGHALYSIVEHE
jgi:hypothetical protein